MFRSYGCVPRSKHTCTHTHTPTPSVLSLSDHFKHKCGPNQISVTELDLSFAVADLILSLLLSLKTETHCPSTPFSLISLFLLLSVRMSYALKMHLQMIINFCVFFKKAWFISCGGFLLASVYVDYFCHPLLDISRVLC